MNDQVQADSHLLSQIERRMEQGQPVDHPLLDGLLLARPQADPVFQRGLEQQLMSRLGALSAQTRQPRVPGRRRWWPTLAAVVTFALGGLVLLVANGLRIPAAASAGLQTTPIVQLAQVVVAAQDIPAGVTITEDMLAVVTLSELDRQVLRQAEPAREVVSDLSAVVGQTAAVDIGWFQPVEAALLSEPCAVDCFELPEGYSQIGLPLPTDGARGLPVGARVDVVAAVEGQLRLMAADVRLTEVTPEFVMLAAPEWQIVGLIKLASSNASVMLRLHTGPELPPRDETWTEYTFIAPEALPADYDFDLMVNVPADRGDVLVGLPYALGPVRATTDGDVLRLWFTDLDVVSIVRGTAVTIRLARADAANLDALIAQGMDLTFIPDV